MAQQLLYQLVTYLILTRKRQTFRKGGTQSHRPKALAQQGIRQRGCRVDQPLPVDVTRH